MGASARRPLWALVAASLAVAPGSRAQEHAQGQEGAAAAPEAQSAVPDPKAAAEPKPAAGDKPEARTDDPTRRLRTVKLQPGHPARRENPVEKAPKIPSDVEINDPDEEALASLGAGPALTPERLAQSQVDADHQFQDAVQLINQGHPAEAEAALLDFARRFGRHAAADNAVYLAGMTREVRGDCAGAVQLFDRVARDYPAGDARLPAAVEKGRCLSALGRTNEAQAVLQRVIADHPDVPEAATARQILESIAISQGGTTR